MNKTPRLSLSFHDERQNPSLVTEDPSRRASVDLVKPDLAPKSPAGQSCPPLLFIPFILFICL